MTKTCDQSVYLPVTARLLRVEPMTDLEKLFTIELPHGYSLHCEPGQFVQVSVFGVGEAPISICSSSNHQQNLIQLCVRRVGDVTNALHRLEPGDTLGIRGPYGHGFPVAKMRGKDVLLVAGGLGLAPLHSLIDAVLDDRGFYSRVIILYGARHPREILFRDDIQEWIDRDDVEFHITVDRGDADWKGNVGVVTTLFPKITFNARNTVAAICGPPVMYRFVLMELLGKGVPETQIYLSLERRMKCGIGKCGQCQINELYCCHDGPVFRYADIRDVKEAL